MPVSDLKQHEDLLHVLKGFAVIFIVWGHHFGSSITTYLFSFNVPLLFFIAGLQFRLDRDTNFLSEVKRLSKKILLPYFIYASALYGIWFLLFFLTGKALEKGFTPGLEFIGVFYSQGMGQYMDWGMHMWFFPCLFFAVIFTLFIINWSKNNSTVYGISIVLFIVGLLSRYIVDFPLPWSIDIACIGQIFIIAGYKLKRFTLKDLNIVNKLIILTVLFTTGYIVQRYNVWIDMKQHVFGNPVLFLVAAFCSILFYYFLSGFLENLKVLSYIGSFSLLIFVFHLRIWTFFNIGFNRIFPGLDHHSALTTFMFTLTQLVAVILITMVVRATYNRYGRKIVVIVR